VLSDVRKRLESIVGKKNIDAIEKHYADAYEDSGLSPEEIWEECICDSLGDLNIFSKLEDTNVYVQSMLGEIKSAAIETTKTGTDNQTRGSPTSTEGKASREPHKGRSEEIETMENNRFSRLRKFHDDLPNMWYAYSDKYFYVYSNQSYMDYKVINKIAIDDTNAQLIDEIERRINGNANSDTRTVDRWIKSFRSGKRLNHRHNDNAYGRGSTGAIDGVDGRSRKSKTGGDSSESDGNSSLTSQIDSGRSGDGGNRTNQNKLMSHLPIKQQFVDITGRRRMS
jgi:hypothetical protein